MFRVVCKNYDEETFSDAQKAFKAACKELHMKEPSVSIIFFYIYRAIINCICCNEYQRAKRDSLFFSCVTIAL